MELSLIDWLIVGAYLAITLGIGLFFRQRANQGLADYFVSGRSLPWWIAGTSMVATTFAADTPLAVTGIIAKDGLAGNWVWWCFALGGMITVFVYARLWRRAEVLTDVELIELRYSGPSAAGLRGARAIYVALIVNPLIIGWVTKAMVTVLTETVLFDATADVAAADGEGGASISNWLIIAGLLALVGVYCTLSGMWGVAMTDLFSFSPRCWDAFCWPLLPFNMSAESANCKANSKHCPTETGCSGSCRTVLPIQVRLPPQNRLRGCH